MNGRTRITRAPSAAAATASGAVNTIAPLAAPGEAATPRAMHVELGVGSNVGCSSASSALGVDRRDRLRARQQALLDGVDGEAHGRLGGALGVARLQHVQAPLLDRELGVLHVPVVALERAQDLAAAGRGSSGIQSRSSERSRGVRTPETTSSPWALARKSPLGSGAPVTSSRENATPEPERVARVAEDHLLDVDRGAPVVGDAVDAAVGDGALAAPGVEHGADRAPQLLARVAREVVEGAGSGA